MLGRLIGFCLGVAGTYCNYELWCLSAGYPMHLKVYIGASIVLGVLGTIGQAVLITVGE